MCKVLVPPPFGMDQARIKHKGGEGPDLAASEHFMMPVKITLGIRYAHYVRQARRKWRPPSKVLFWSPTRFKIPIHIRLYPPEEPYEQPGIIPNWDQVAWALFPRSLHNQSRRAFKQKAIASSGLTGAFDAGHSPACDPSSRRHLQPLVLP